MCVRVSLCMFSLSLPLSFSLPLCLVMLAALSESSWIGFRSHSGRGTSASSSRGSRSWRSGSSVAAFFCTHCSIKSCCRCTLPSIFIMLSCNMEDSSCSTSASLTPCTLPNSTRSCLWQSSRRHTSRRGAWLGFGPKRFCAWSWADKDEIFVSKRPVLLSHHVKSRPRTLRGTRNDREPMATKTFFLASASSTAICVPDCPEPTTSTAPSGSSCGFLYPPECTW
jgi:hypothetical protein